MSVMGEEWTWEGWNGCGEGQSGRGVGVAERQGRRQGGDRWRGGGKHQRKRGNF